MKTHVLYFMFHRCEHERKWQKHRGDCLTFFLISLYNHHQNVWAVNMATTEFQVSLLCTSVTFVFSDFHLWWLCCSLHTRRINLPRPRSMQQGTKPVHFTTDVTEALFRYEQITCMFEANSHNFQSSRSQSNVNTQTSNTVLESLRITSKTSA